MTTRLGLDRHKIMRRINSNRRIMVSMGTTRVDTVIKRPCTSACSEIIGMGAVLRCIRFMRI
jgi:hypothetical protein